MKIVCIGAAPTSLGAAYRLNQLREEGNAAAADVEFVILEQALSAGGLSGSVVDERGFSWDKGVHITYHEGQPYYERAVKWAVGGWNECSRAAMVDMAPVFNEAGLHLVPYPAQFAVPLFPAETKEACLRELSQRYEQDPSDEPPKHFEEWARRQFGPTITEAFFLPYTRKVWSVEAREMGHQWVGLRVAKLPREKLEELCSLDPEQIKNTDFGWGGNSAFCYPQQGGMGAVWTEMAKRLPAEWIKYGRKMMHVDYARKRVIYRRTEGNEEDEGEEMEEAYDVLLSTAPIDQLIRDTRLTTPLNVKYNRVTVVGVGLHLPLPPSIAPYTWLYFPDERVPFFRFSLHSKFGDVTPDASKYWSLLCETATPIEDTENEESIKERVLAGLITKGIIEEGKIATVWSMTLPYGYPIPTIERDAELARAHRELEKHSIYSRGRFGGWKYEVSNQDHCFVQGREVVDRVLFGTPETMYKTGVVDSKQG